MNNNIDILGFGAVAVDDLVYVDHYPSPDSKIPIRAYQRQGGGLAGTALVAAARLGARVAYCGAFGTDELSKFTLEEFSREGVGNCHILKVNDAKPIHSIIIVDKSTGQRVVMHTNSGLSAPPLDYVTKHLIKTAKFVFIDHTVMQVALKVTRIARNIKIITIADIERDDDNNIIELLSLIDHLIIGITIAKKLTGLNNPLDILHALSNKNQVVCIVTNGANGCYYKKMDEPVEHFPAFCVPVVDTTGCGDVFHGGYMAAMTYGFPIEKSIQFATAVAGIKASHAGGRSGIPSYKQVIQFLLDRGFEI